MHRFAASASFAFAALLCAPLASAQPAATAAASASASTAASAKVVDPVRVKLTTSDGVIVLELDRVHAPITVDNFVQYVKDKHLEGTIFHRVIPGFMIQGGGFTPKFEEKKTRAPIKLEARNGLSNVRGAVAMARTDDRDSATSQFFINLANNGASGPARVRSLDTMGGGYAVFGMVVEGMEVVDKIAAIPTGPGGPFARDVPSHNVIIQKAELVTAPKPKKAAPPAATPPSASATAPAATPATTRTP